MVVLVHSPSVGPATWQPVAAELRARGRDVLVPSLLDVGVGQPPYWPRVVYAVRDALSATAPDRPVVLVVHSNAGLFVPAIRTGLVQPVFGSVFVDAALPARTGATPVVPEQHLRLLRGMADPAGRLPRWTDWFDEADVAPMFSDPVIRHLIVGEQPRLPLAYYEQAVPVAPGWDDHPCGYLAFGPPYDRLADEAAERGWPVLTVPGRHLHQTVDPVAVSTAILSLLEVHPGPSRSTATRRDAATST
ncbi:alpha/beta hydrolase [Plantactinospora sp. S1510]|uniref:Alpha/beta hydrolase n=1 Tax=Plantactinospora alkalitolerans TaxID=2789879 RepID=A0ABS0H023_9ACTN|nr:alpha/beta hydrolase [Plantactinospora alkalitolerans]